MAIVLRLRQTLRTITFTVIPPWIHLEYMDDTPRHPRVHMRCPVSVFTSSICPGTLVKRVRCSTKEHSEGFPESLR